MSALDDMDRCVAALALELPEAIYQDVVAKYAAFRREFNEERYLRQDAERAAGRANHLLQQMKVSAFGREDG